MLSFNWIDYLILAVFAFYAYQGSASGFIRATFDLINFALSFLIGLRFYGIIAGVLIDKLSMPHGFSSAIGFFITALIAEFAMGVLIKSFLAFDPPFLKTINKIFGILPGVLSGVILTSFILILIVGFPTATPVKHSVSSSKIGNLLLTKSQKWEKQLNEVFGDTIAETINFLTIEPKGNEIVSLNLTAKNVYPDAAAEQDMFKLINQERDSRGINKIISDNGLRDLGRKHCEDMFEKGYFSHYAPEGLSPFDRMDEAGILYDFAGENLALAPNTDIAMQGLMNSLGHKANILSTDFGRIGIGVIDGGIYGKMFCQEFTD